MKRMIALATVLLAMLIPALADADDPTALLEELRGKGAQAVLEEADNRHNPFKDQTIETEMILQLRAGS